jgi:hypothetical protein
VIGNEYTAWEAAIAHHVCAYHALSSSLEMKRRLPIVQKCWRV